MFRIRHYGRQLDLGATILKSILPFVSTDETRHVLQHVNLAGVYVEATDGHKAIRFNRAALDCPDAPDGVYKVVKDGKEYLLVPAPDAGTFPNMANIIPTKWRRQITIHVGGKTWEGEALFKLARAGVRMDPKILGALPEGHYTVGVTSATGPVLAQSHQAIVVLMPMRGEKGAAFTLGKYRREPLGFELEALHDEALATNAALNAITPESVAADVAAINAMFETGQRVPGSKEIVADPHAMTTARMKDLGLKPGQETTDPLCLCNSCEFRAVDPADPRGYCPACIAETDRVEVAALAVATADPDHGPGALVPAWLAKARAAAGK